jgi:hypothetical protein
MIPYGSNASNGTPIVAESFHDTVQRVPFRPPLGALAEGDGVDVVASAASNEVDFISWRFEPCSGLGLMSHHSCQATPSIIRHHITVSIEINR